VTLSSILTADFLSKGIVKFPVEDMDALDRIRDFVMRPFHSFSLNAQRLELIREMNAQPWLRDAYYSLARNALSELVGNELAMQRSINLSIQLPNDSSSLLPIHCDTWSGDSPYEVVLWAPLVDCYGTKSMYFHKPGPIKLMADAEKLWESVKDEVTFMDVKYGEALIFTQNIMHGNRVNETNETRWSMNCRFKSLWSPYGDKKLGEFFLPLNIKPASRMGMDYEYPQS
jgi:sporadic carbohydrate cluster 2OG-Fe(II) oxygenase